MEYYKQERRLQEKKHFQKEESPMKIIGAVGGLIGAGVTYFGARNRARESQAMLDDARGRMDSAMDVYASTDISNPFEGMKNEFAGMENQFAGMKNQFAGLENTMEDLTVNQQQAQFQAQQNQQQQANIMSNLAGAAGGSGIAALAQTLAQQGQIATQRASASIAQQEAMNARLAAQQAARNQELEAKGVQIQQDKEMAKQGTLLGMEQSRVAAYMQQGQQADKAKFDAITGTVGNLVDLGVAYSGYEASKN